MQEQNSLFAALAEAHIAKQLAQIELHLDGRETKGARR